MFSRTALAVAVLTLVAGHPALAVTPQQKCAVLKLKASGKKLAAKMTCYAKGKAKALPVDPACLAKAETKFDAAMVKAGNACPGTAADLEAAVDANVAALAADVPGDGKCSAKTALAAGKAGNGLLSCQAKAVTKGATALPPCDVKNTTKFGTAVQKAGACADATVLDADIHSGDSAIGAIIDGTAVTTTTSTTAPPTTTSTTTPVTTTTTTIPTCPLVAEWGGPTDFGLAFGVAVNASGDVFVADPINHRVQRFTNTGTFVTSYDIPVFPIWVAVDGDSNIFVLTIEGSVWEITDAGTFVTAWSFSTSSSPTRRLAADPIGNVFISKDGNRIQKFTNTGTFITEWGGDGSADGAFSGVGGLAVDGSGNVFVADSGNTRVQKFTNAGTFISSWNPSNTPSNITVDSSGNVFVADGLIEKFTNTGTFIASWLVQGVSPGGFLGFGMAVDSSGNVFLAGGDVLNDHNTVVKFACP